MWIVLVFHSATKCIGLDKSGYQVNIFLFLHENICCGYSLEASRRGTTYEYPQHMFLSRNKNKKSAESDVAPAGIKSYKFLFVLKKIHFAVFKKLMG